MKYGEIKRKVLELTDRWSVAGTEISPAYNGQTDLLLRIPGLVNDGVVRVREKLPAVGQVTLGPEGGETVGEYRSYMLPEDFRFLRSGRVWRVEKGRLVRERNWLDWGDTVLLPPGTYTLEYWKHPELLPVDPMDDYDYGERTDVCGLAAYYAAAMLVSGEDTALYSILMQQFREGVEALQKAWCRSGTVEDVYGGLGA